MAKIVLGLGSSHTPMLLASDETLPRFQETDQRIKHRDREGQPVTYAELLEKADPKMAHMVAPAELVARQNQARAAGAHLSKVLNTAKLDALIVMSDDQDEAYLEDNRPTFAIYYGETILNSNEQHEQYHKRFPEWYVQNRQGFFEDAKPRGYPVDSKLALHTIEYLMDNGFDPASSKRMREGEGEGHGMAYVHRRLMDAANPIPIIIPCHRVVATNGPGGYSGGDGLPTKRALLLLEGLLLGGSDGIRAVGDNRQATLI